jgi:hypothetical protein
VVFIRLDTNALMKTPSPLKTASKGLAGALAIASGSSAYGAIVSASSLPTDIFPATFPTTSTTVVNWDVNGDSVIDFTFSFRQPQTAGVDWQANMNALTNSAVLGYVGPSFPYAERLINGQAVAPSGTNVFVAGLASPGKQVIISSIFASTPYGQFQPPNSTGFIGFQFTVGANTFNGYIQLKVGRSFGIDFISAFYNNTPGGAITAGQVPEPGTLALLAFGAVGVVGAIAKRRKALAS